uniref:RNA binding motif protein 33 n=1 Tax=Leptobrachium leishanense TaxID=445787 RepID=A0A8C5W9A3_9ANUR
MTTLISLISLARKGLAEDEQPPTTMMIGTASWRIICWKKITCLGKRLLPTCPMKSSMMISFKVMKRSSKTYNSQAVTVSLNATGASMFDLSKSANEEIAEEEPEYDEENEAVFEELAEPEIPAEDFSEPYEENESELATEHIEYGDEETVDEVLDLEINEPIDEFQEEDTVQVYSREEAEDEQQYADEVVEDTTGMQDTATDPEEQVNTSSQELQEMPSVTKDDSDEEDEEEEDGGRIRFKTERKEGTIIRLSDVTRERRNIPETLELSAEAKATLMEFEETERMRKMGRYASRRGGRRGGNNMMQRAMVDHRHEMHERRNVRPQRPSPGQAIRSLFHHPPQQQIQPLLPGPRSRNPSSDGMSSSPQQDKQHHDKQRGNSLISSPPQPKNIHINPHFKGNVAPVPVPLLPIPNQARPPVGPPRFPGMPDFQHVPGPVPGNFNQPPRLQEPWRNPPPQPEREPFFIGEPRFPNHHLFDQRNPPPIPPPPLLNSHPIQNPMQFNQPGQGFNQPGPQPRFPQPGPQPSFNPPGPGPQQGFNQPGPQPSFNQSGFNPPGPQPGFNPPGPQPGFNQPPRPQPNFNPPGPQPGFNQPNFNPPGPQPGFNQAGPQPPFTQPGFNQPGTGPQPGFNQPGPAPQPRFNQPGPGPQQGFNQAGFPRAHPVRLNMPTPSPMGIPPFNQNSPNIRHFPPPRPPFPPGPGQPFMPPTQPNMQGPMQPPLHQPHHLSGPPKPPVPHPQQQQFRPHSQNQQVLSNNRIQGQPRQGPPKQRLNIPGQNVGMGANQQAQHARNSNLRELPIASPHSMNMGRKRPGLTPAAQVKPMGSAVSQARAAKAAIPPLKPPTPTTKVKEVKIEEQFPDEDEETRKYRLKIEEQKRLREEILRRKELRRQQQAGARKRELLERLSQQHQSVIPHQAQVEQEKPAVQPPNNGNPFTPQTVQQARPNMKARPNAVVQKPEGAQKIPAVQQTVTANLQNQVPRKKILKPAVPNRVVMDNLGQKPQEQRLAGTKRTVMQRTNSTSSDVPHVAPKVRVIKLSAGEGDNALVPSHVVPPMMSPQQRAQVQPQTPFQQRPQPQQRPGPVRKVTLGKGSVQNPFLPQQRQQHLQQQHLQQQHLQQQHLQGGPPVPQMVIMRGRGRGVAGQMGRGRPMPNKQNLVDCTPQLCAVSVEGLSSSTTDLKLKNLLMSVGPIQSFEMLPHQRKAIATFKEPGHASAFQQKFHRHMIDLSHINVSLVAELKTLTKVWGRQERLGVFRRTALGSGVSHTDFLQMVFLSFFFFLFLFLNVYLACKSLWTKTDTAGSNLRQTTRNVMYFLGRDT